MEKIAGSIRKTHVENRVSGEDRLSNDETNVIGRVSWEMQQLARESPEFELRVLVIGEIDIEGVVDQGRSIP